MSIIFQKNILKNPNIGDGADHSGLSQVPEGLSELHRAFAVTSRKVPGPVVIIQ